jgi:hypothetical protein
MSGAVTFVAANALPIAAASAAAATGYSIYAGERAADQAERARREQAAIQNKSLAMQKQAQAEASAAAEKQAKASEQAMNAANRKSPDVSSIVAAAETTQQGGVGSTMLTGPTGVDPNDLKLGKSTLLGA